MRRRREREDEAAFEAADFRDSIYQRRAARSRAQDPRREVMRVCERRVERGEPASRRANITITTRVSDGFVGICTTRLRLKLAPIFLFLFRIRLLSARSIPTSPFGNYEAFHESTARCRYRRFTRGEANPCAMQMYALPLLS